MMVLDVSIMLDDRECMKSRVTIDIVHVTELLFIDVLLVTVMNLSGKRNEYDWAIGNVANL